MIENIVLELILIIFAMLLCYVISNNYFGLVWILGIVSMMVVLIDFTVLSAVFDSVIAGALFWTGVIFYFVLMPFFKTLIFYEKLGLHS